MYKILTLNNISPVGVERLPREDYEVASEIQHQDAVLLRCYNMHDLEIPSTVKSIGRAGAGVNNIPVDVMSTRGVPVFNAPGANANAVKELVIAGMLMAARNLARGWDFARTLEGTDEDIHRKVESGKKQFVGFELPGKTLGVVGLGAIGVQVANGALALGMNVIGFDPGITVQRAWEMSSDVRQAASVEELLAAADFVSFHVPLVDATSNMINAERLRLARDNVVILNFSRNGVVDDEAVVAAIDSGKTVTIARPASFTAGFAPRRCAPMPWKAVKKNRIRPMQNDEAQTCCGAKGRGLVLPKAHMENAGAD